MVRGLGDTLQPLALDRLDLFLDQVEPRHVAIKLGKGVVGQGNTFRRAQLSQPLGRLAKRRLEVANAQADQA